MRIFRTNLRNLPVALRRRVQTDNSREAGEALSLPKGYAIHPKINLLNQADKKVLHKVINAARTEINKNARNALNREQVKAILEKHFASLPFKEAKALRELKPIFDQLIQDSLSGDFHETRKLIDEIKPNFVIGFFQVPYIKGLEKESLELVTFDDFDTSKVLPPEFKQEFCNTRARAVTNVRTTPGLSDLRNVALFPEFFVVQKNDKGHSRNNPDSTAYYFIDRFQERLRLALPVLRSGLINKNSFADLKTSKNEKKLQGISAWLSAHEHYHSEGPLPRVLRKAKDGSTTDESKQYGYEIKNKKATGAFEELRVDLETMIKAFSPEGVRFFGNKGLGPVTGELILFERLIRYAYSRDPDKDFDALTSHILLNYLETQGALNINDKGVLSLKPRQQLVQALKALLTDMNSLETKIAQGNLSTPESRKRAINEITPFVNEWAGKHNDGTISLHPFYASLREAVPLRLLKYR